MIHLLAQCLLAMSILWATPAFAAKPIQVPESALQAMRDGQEDGQETLQRLEEALREAKSSERTAIMAFLGEQHRLQNDSVSARRVWEDTIKIDRKGRFAQASRLGIALLNASASLDNRTINALLKVNQADGFDTQNADRLLLLIQDAASQHDLEKVAEYARLALEVSESNPKLLLRVQTHLDFLAGPGAGPDSAADEPPKSPIQQAEQALRVGDLDTARDLAQQILDSTDESEDKLAARYLLRRFDAAPVRPGSIAVFIPLSGKYAVVGEQVKEAFNAGYQAANPTAPALNFVDTGETVEDAVAQLERVVLEEGAIAVVGPVRSDFAEPFIQAANALRIPVASLSQATGTTNEREFAFQLMANAEHYVNALLDHAMTVHSMQKFAIFAPTSSYGTSATAVFQRAVEAKGGEIVVTEFYDHESTDLLEFAKALGRKDYEARAAEFRQLKEDTKERGGKLSRLVLPPQIDFDAIFIPDSARRVPLACAALAFEEFPIGNFKTATAGVTVPLLGLSSWNNTAIVGNGGTYVQNSLFTDVYLPTAETSLAFIEEFRMTHERNPSSLEALATDAGRVFGEAIKAGSETREDFRQSLLDLEIETPLTGITGFENTSGLANYNVQILTITRTGIEMAPLTLEVPEGEEESSTNEEGATNE